MSFLPLLSFDALFIFNLLHLFVRSDIWNLCDFFLYLLPKVSSVCISRVQADVVLCCKHTSQDGCTECHLTYCQLCSENIFLLFFQQSWHRMLPLFIIIMCIPPTQQKCCVHWLTTSSLSNLTHHWWPPFYFCSVKYEVKICVKRSDVVSVLCAGVDSPNQFFLSDIFPARS